jgi:hypothetical protein
VFELLALPGVETVAVTGIEVDLKRNSNFSSHFV